MTRRVKNETRMPTTMMKATGVIKVNTQIIILYTYWLLLVMLLLFCLRVVVFSLFPCREEKEANGGVS
jgi:hypothetical protein